MKHQDWQLCPARDWAGGCMGWNSIPWLCCPVATAQPVAPIYGNSAKWQWLYLGYFGFVLFSGRNWRPVGHVSPTVYGPYMQAPFFSSLYTLIVSHLQLPVTFCAKSQLISVLLNIIIFLFMTSI